MGNGDQAPIVAIIGGGIAGIATCRALVIRGISCKLFETQPHVGGLWVDNYPGARIQAGHILYQFPDKEFPKESEDNPTAAAVRDYCDEYVAEWRLEEHLHLSTRVDNVTQRPGGGFTVETKPGQASSAAAASEDFTHVIVCSGVFSGHPFIPDVPGLNSFKGLKLHSSQRRNDGVELAGRKVVVVGGNKSAQDAAAAASAAGATSVVHALRTPHWPVPFKFFGFLPYRWMFHNRSIQKILPMYPGRPLGPLGKCARAVTAPVRGVIWRSMEAMLLMHYRVTRRLWPRSRAVHDIPALYIYTSEYMRALRKGKVDARVAEVACVGANSITLCHKAQEASRGGTKEELSVDTLVFATGFDDVHDFLDEGIKKQLNRQPDGLPLYRQIVPPEVPGLMFVGRGITFTNPATFSVQAMWVAEVLQGQVTLPGTDEMAAETAVWSEALSHVQLTPIRRHMVTGQGDRYNQGLLRDMRVAKLARYGGPFGALANMVLPHLPKDYCNAIQPEAMRTCHSLRPPLWLKAVTLGIVGVAVKALRRQ